MGNNEELDKQPEEQKSQEQLKAEKFAENPDNFVDLDDLILAVKRSDKGKVCDGFIETYIGKITRVELEIALMRITHSCNGIFNAMSHAQQQAQKKILHPPKGGVVDFARRLRR